MLLFCLRWSPRHKEGETIPDFWFLLATLSRQNPWEKEPDSGAYRAFVGPWWLFVFVLTTVYSARLVSMTSVAVYGPWLADPESLERALASREALLCVERATIFIEYIKASNVGALNQVRLQQLEGGRENTVLVSDRRTGLERTLRDRYVYMDSRVSLLSSLQRLLSEEDRRALRVVAEHLGIEYCGFAFQKACPLRDLFDRS
ncbi:glutamate receptor ionotropic, delta-1-like [Haemaphysalis longicornis]